jgi:uncharacterized membrane protein
MKTKINSLEKMILVSIGFTMSLLFIRILFTRELTYGFFPWNTILAVVPLLFSRKLSIRKEWDRYTIILLLGWLLFFPNAPYIITDLFHFSKDEGVPFWFDLILVVSGTWNGTLLGLISLMQVEQFLQKKLSRNMANFIIMICILLCGYGIYLGRYLRYNSWDILTKPYDLISVMSNHIMSPFENTGIWAFTMGFSLMFGIIYFTIKQLIVFILSETHQNLTEISRE